MSCHTICKFNLEKLINKYYLIIFTNEILISYDGDDSVAQFLVKCSWTITTRDVDKQQFESSWMDIKKNYWPLRRTWSSKHYLCVHFSLPFVLAFPRLLSFLRDILTPFLRSLIIIIFFFLLQIYLPISFLLLLLLFLSLETIRTISRFPAAP